MRLLKLIYWASISLICFWILVAILGLFLPIEVTDNKIENTYYEIRFWGLPIAILLTLSGTIESNDASVSLGGEILATLFAAGISVFFMFMAMFLGMCDWTTDRMFFENKQDRSIKIVERSFGCGATDSGSPIHKIFKMTPVTKYFVWVTEIDTNSIDKSEWVRIENAR